jgi:tetratricopeptide (TPR) repeat protein
MLLLENNNFIPYSGHAIITTRYKQEAFRAPGILKKLELDVLGQDDAVVVFRSLGSRYGYESKQPTQDDKFIRKLLQKLQGHALGIEQMVAYIAFKSMSAKEFLDEYEKKSRKIHGYDGTNKEISRFNLATLWDMHFEELSKSDEGKSSLRLLGLLSLLAPDAIRSELLTTDGDPDIDAEYKDLCSEEDRLVLYAPILHIVNPNREILDIAKDLLVKHALVKEQGDTLSLHRLVQTAFDFSEYGFARNGRQSAFHTIGRLLNARFPKMGGPVSLYSRWEQCSQLLPHCQSLKEAYLRYQGTKGCLRSSPDLDELFKNVAWYLLESGEPNESLKVVTVAQEMCLDKEGLLYAQLCNNAGCIHFELNSSSAEDSLNECRRIRVAKLHEDHSELANIYNNLALYYTSVGRIEEAYSLMKRRLEMALNDPETEVAYLGFSHLGLGRIYLLRAQDGDDVAALEHFEAAHNLWEPLGSSGNWMMVQ